MKEITNKSFFRNYAFFLLLLFVVFGILTYMSLVSKKYWNNNLAVSVQQTLDEYESGTWKVMDSIEINKPVSVNCAAFKVINNQTKQEASAVIIRITTFYGPLPGVFIQTQDEKTIFAGYSSLHGRIQKQISSAKSDKRREYWQSKIPEILNQ